MSQGNKREQQRKTLGVLFWSPQEDTWNHSRPSNAHTKMYSTQRTVHSHKCGQVQTYTKCWQVLHMVFPLSSSQMKLIWRTDVVCMGFSRTARLQQTRRLRECCLWSDQSYSEKYRIFAFYGTFCLSLRKSPFPSEAQTKLENPLEGS